MTGGKKTVVCPLGLLRIAFWLISMGVACGFSTAGESPKDRLAKAETMFQERCKSSGEKIYRTVENVSGIFLMKLRLTRNFSNQFALDDPYGRDLVGDGYIESLIRGEFQATHSGMPPAGSPHQIGYSYVEAIDHIDGKRYRYTGSVREVEEKLSGLSGGGTVRITKFVLNKAPSDGAPPRYGVTYSDISTREEREYWIAGSSLKVIDLKTNEVLAERVGYMMDRGQGNRSGGRSPWLLAADHACPEFAPLHGATAQPYQTLNFVEKVLKPKVEK